MQEAHNFFAYTRLKMRVFAFVIHSIDFIVL